MSSIAKGFKEFIARGNAVELAIGIVLGVAFGAVIQAIVDYLISPLIAAIFGDPNLDSLLTFTLNGAHFSIGAILTTLLNFLFVAAAIYFLVVIPINKMQERRRKADVPPEEKPENVALLEEIRDLLAERSSRS